MPKKSVSPEKTSRLAPIGGVTKLNPLLDEQNQLSGSITEPGGAGELEAELPTQAVSVWCVESVLDRQHGGMHCEVWSECHHVMYVQCALLSPVSPSTQLEDLKLTGGAADGWMLY